MSAWKYSRNRSESCKACSGELRFDQKYFCSASCRKEFSVVLKICEQCDESFRVHRSHAHRIFTCGMACRILLSRKDALEFNGFWFFRNTEGYFYSHAQGLLHREIWKFNLGPIPDGYVIHHRNEIKDDNRIENLQMMTEYEHILHHHEERVAKTKASNLRGEWQPVEPAKE